MAFGAVIVTAVAFLFVLLPSSVISDCPNEFPEYKKDVDLKQLSGMWYEYGASTRDFPYLFADDKCVPLYFHEVTKPSLHYIYYKNVSEGDTMRTVASFYLSGGSYRITYIRAKEYLRGTFLVLDTDYKCWATVYACAKSAPVYVSVLQRSVDGKKCFNEATGNEVGKALEKVKLKLTDLSLNQNGDACEYTPSSTELI